MDFLKKYSTGNGDYQGMFILCFAVGKLKFDWFTDCGEWFIYIYWGDKYYRFSSAGSFGGKRG